MMFPKIYFYLAFQISNAHLLDFGQSPHYFQGICREKWALVMNMIGAH